MAIYKGPVINGGRDLPLSMHGCQVYSVGGIFNSRDENGQIVKLVAGDVCLCTKITLKDIPLSFVSFHTGSSPAIFCGDTEVEETGNWSIKYIGENIPFKKTHTKVIGFALATYFHRLTWCDYIRQGIVEKAIDDGNDPDELLRLFNKVLDTTMHDDFYFGIRVPSSAASGNQNCTCTWRIDYTTLNTSNSLAESAIVNNNYEKFTYKL